MKLPSRILALFLADVQAQLALFTTSAWRVGWLLKCRRKKLIAWSACIGSSSNVKFAKRPTPISSKLKTKSTSWSTYNSQSQDTIWSWNHCPLRRTLPELFMCLDSHRKSLTSTWVEVTNQKWEWTTYLWVDVMPSSSTSKMGSTSKITDPSSAHSFSSKKHSHSN